MLETHDREQLQLLIGLHVRRNRLPGTLTQLDLERELQYHLDRRVEDLIDDGLSEPDARRQANLGLGGVPQVQEAVRDTWIWRWLDDLARDVRGGMRSLTRSWGFSLGVGAVLALAIGANVAIFSVVNVVLLQPLPYAGADRLVALETFWINTGRVIGEGIGLLQVAGEAPDMDLLTRDRFRSASVCHRGCALLAGRFTSRRQRGSTSLGHVVLFGDRGQGHAVTHGRG